MKKVYLFIMVLVVAMMSSGIEKSYASSDYTSNCFFGLGINKLYLGDKEKGSIVGYIYCRDSNSKVTDVSVNALKSDVLKIEDYNDMPGYRAFLITALSLGDSDLNIDMTENGTRSVTTFTMHVLPAVQTETPLTGNGGQASGGTGDKPKGDKATEEAAANKKILASNLQLYYSKVTPLRKYETNANHALSNYRTVTSKNRVDAYNALTKSIIPNYEKLLKGLKEIKTTDGRIKANNELYIKGVSDQLQSLYLMKRVVATKKVDAKTYLVNVKQFDAGQTNIVKWANQMNVLKKQAGI